MARRGRWASLDCTYDFHAGLPIVQDPVFWSSHNFGYICAEAGPWAQRLAGLSGGMALRGRWRCMHTLGLAENHNRIFQIHLQYVCHTLAFRIAPSDRHVDD